jgi:periplasmic copper chaperone A
VVAACHRLRAARALLFCLLAVSAGAARAQGAEARIGNLTVSGVGARATPPGTTVGAVYFSITNSGRTADRLESVSTPIARAVRIHTSSAVHGVMQMREVDAVECPPGATVKAEPGGLHVMLIGLSAPLTLGDAFAVSLHFHAAGVLTLKVPVT